MAAVKTPCKKICMLASHRKTNLNYLITLPPIARGYTLGNTTNIIIENMLSHTLYSLPSDYLRSEPNTLTYCSTVPSKSKLTVSFQSRSSILETRENRGSRIELLLASPSRQIFAFLSVSAPDPHQVYAVATMASH